MAGQYVVTGPLVIVRGADGADRYIYGPGGVLPPDSELRAGEADRLVETGLVTKGDPDKIAAEQSKGDADESPPADPDAKPTQRSSKAEWEAYAVSQGMDPQDAADATKGDLVDKYGG